MEPCKYCGSDPVFITKTYANKVRERYLVCVNPECLAQTEIFTSSGPSLDSIKAAYSAWNSGNYEQPVPPNGEEEEEAENE